MRRVLATLTGVVLAAAPGLVWAEGTGGSYRGIAQIYYAFISFVLIYGVHDVFRNKKVTLAAAIVIPVVLYGFLLPKG
jgi:hypothetical protein